MLASSDPNQRILVLHDGRPVPILSGSESGHMVATIAPGVMIERHTFSTLEVSHHFHPTHCLHLQTAGVSRVRWRSEGKSGIETMRASSLMLHGRGTSDSIDFAGESSRVVVSLDPASIANTMMIDGGHLFDHCPSRWHFQDRQLERLVRNFEAEAENSFHTGHVYAELLCLSLAAYLMRHYGGARLLLPSVKGGLPKGRLDRVLEYIAANLSQPLSLMEIAVVADMSVYHFARLFKCSTGLSPHQYVLAQRIDRAKNLLLGGIGSVIDVALASGFNDHSYFSKTFRKATGISPMCYRAQLK